MASSVKIGATIFDVVDQIYTATLEHGDLDVALDAMADYLNAQCIHLTHIDSVSPEFSFKIIRDRKATTENSSRTFCANPEEPEFDLISSNTNGSSLETTLNIVATDTNTARTTITLNREVGNTDFSDHEGALLIELAPHLERVMKIKRDFARLKKGAQAGREALNNFALPTVMIDEIGQVLGANSAAREFASSNDKIVALNNYFSFTNTEVNNAFLNAVGDLLKKGGSATDGRVAGVQLPISTEIDGYAVILKTGIWMVNSGKGEIANVNYVDRELVVAFIVDHQSSSSPSRESLQQLFGLTATEANVMAMLADGDSVDRIARYLSISRHTVRDHLKSIFRKTDTKSQPELIRAVYSRVFWLRDL